ncbi:MAG: hypothetical protein KZQ93_08200 [Candidatus Thiodiazotropha sp. (ex Monitilora ramsayi)]|nr:hypothetical protein [Candidatus Thiodiazotropha sp. (ex Monitilora ramsayi)]
MTYALLTLVKRRRFLLSGVNGFLGLSLTMVGGFATLLLLNVQTYQQLTREIALAEIVIGESSLSGTSVQLVTQQSSRSFSINTPEWRLDARFIKWKPWMSLLGKTPVVRLESIAERTSDLDVPIRRYDVARDNLWLDGFVSEISRHMGLIDSVYGSSVYMPVETGAKYEVTATVSGLLARPINPTAKKAVLDWSQP